MRDDRLIEIEKQLYAGARQVAPTDWLANLFSSRHVDAKSAAAYITQSPYHSDGKWDVPQNLWTDSDADKYDTETDAEYDKRCPTDPWKGANECLQQRFMDIFNDVLFYFGLSKGRKALATESADDEFDDIHHRHDKPGSRNPDFSTRPDIVVLGEDSRQLPRNFDSYRRDMSISQNGRQELYQGCVAVAKVKKVAGDGGGERMVEKLATAAEQCFLYQPGRRFLFGVILSNSSFQLVYFDRGGAVESPALDIHSHAQTFVQIIRMLGDPDLTRLGFDSSFHWDNGRRYVDIRGVIPGSRKLSSRTYEIERIMYQRPRLVDRGTTCWVVKKDGSDESVMMKDTWHGEDSDGSELFRLAAKQGIEGVAKDLFIASKSTSISSLRNIHCLTGTPCQDRIFSRTISELQGSSLTHFESGLHLVETLRDAIQVHYRLVQVGILHRDIAPDNILFNKRDRDGRHRAVLIHLENGTQFQKGTVRVAMDKYTNGRSMSGSIINHWAEDLGDLVRHSHDFLDDLESFFWTYLWILMVQNGPGPEAFVAENNPFVGLWTAGMNRPGMLWSPKAQYFTESYPPWYLAVTPYFSHPPYTTLVDDLRKFFSAYYNGNCTERRPSQELFPHMDGIYQQVLGFFDKAIAQLGGAPNVTTTPPLPLPTDDPMPVTSQLPKTIAPPLQLPRRVQPYRPGKRTADEDPTSDLRAKRQRLIVSEPQLDTSEPVKVEPFKSNRHRVVREGVRRSERIRDLKEKRTVLVASGKKVNGSRKR